MVACASHPPTFGRTLYRVEEIRLTRRCHRMLSPSVPDRMREEMARGDGCKPRRSERMLILASRGRFSSFLTNIS
jgi:hypothetical protein